MLIFQCAVWVDRKVWTRIFLLVKKKNTLFRVRPIWFSQVTNYLLSLKELHLDQIMQKTEQKKPLYLSIKYSNLNCLFSKEGISSRDEAGRECAELQPSANIFCNLKHMIFFFLVFFFCLGFYQLQYAQTMQTEDTTAAFGTINLEINSTKEL